MIRLSFLAILVEARSLTPLVHQLMIVFVTRWLLVVLLAAVVVAVSAVSVVSAHSTISTVTTVAACAPGEENSPVLVLVADQLIRKGTTGSMIVKRAMAKVSTSPCAEVARDAFSKLADLKGRRAIRDIYPGQILIRRVFTSVHSPTTYRIDHVTDGDTVVLRNGQKVRLVQIDTPEVYFGTRVLRAAGIGDD